MSDLTVYSVCGLSILKNLSKYFFINKNCSQTHAKTREDHPVNISWCKKPLKTMQKMSKNPSYHRTHILP